MNSELPQLEPAADDPLLGKVIAERYRIDARIGEGGMGNVYRATHVRMQSPFAVKVLHRHAATAKEAGLRFEREAMVAGRLRHPHLVTATDFGEQDEGVSYLVLEYVEGEELASLVAAGALETRRALHVALQLARALAAMHAAEVLHRDIKPENVVLVDHEGQQDFVKLLDFGMAKVTLGPGSGNRPITGPGTILGTPRYMAPEQAASLETDARADLYSFGMVLYEMLTGRTPFGGASVAEVLRQQRFEAPEPLPESIDSDLAALVMQLIRKVPSERPANAQEVFERLDTIFRRLFPDPLAERRSWQGAASARLVISPIARALGPLRRLLPPGPVRTWTRLEQVVATGVTMLAVGVLLSAGVVGVQRLSAARASSRHVQAVLPPMAARPSPAAADRAAAGRALQREAAEREAEVARRSAEQLAERVELGDAEALAALARKPPEQRSGREWLALGLAWMKDGRVADAMVADLRALERDEHVASDPRLVAQLRRVMEHPEHFQEAQRLAALLPGPEGADLLASVWLTTPRETRVTSHARLLLEQPSVRKRASRALDVALALRAARTCADFEALVPAALDHGDTRSLRPLLVLMKREGCGPEKHQDCFACLRDAPLVEAIHAVQQRFEPKY